MNEESQVEIQEESIETLKSQLAEAQKAIESLASKKDELLKETKAAKEEKRKQADLVQVAKQEQLAVAEKNGEFERLFKAEREERTKLEELLSSTKKEQRNEKIGLAAMKVAVDLAKGDANKAELLSEFLAKSISNVADELGRIDEDTLNSVRKQFESDKRYAPLLGGNLSNGGSAPGNARGAGVSQTINRAEFDQMPAYKKSEFITKVRDGKAQLTD